MAFQIDRLFAPCLVFEDANAFRADDRLMVEFPAEWINVLATTTAELVILNKGHSICERVSTHGWAAFHEFSSKKSVGAFLEEILATNNPELAAAWLLSAAGEDSEYWNALKDHLAAAFARVLQLAGLSNNEQILIWKSQHNPGLRRISAGGCDFKEGYVVHSLRTLLPYPADRKWLIYP